MSCPNLIEDGNKNEATPVMNHYQELIIDNNATKEKTKSRISYFTIITSLLLISMLAVTSGSEPTATGIANRSKFIKLFFLILSITDIYSWSFRQ
jgi:hypothetical protein